MIPYGFKVGLIQCFQLAFGNEDSYYYAIFWWFAEFESGYNSLLDEERTKRLLSAVMSDNVSAIQTMVIDNKHCMYQMIQNKLNIRS